MDTKGTKAAYTQFDKWNDCNYILNMVKNAAGLPLRPAKDNPHKSNKKIIEWKELTA